MTPLAPGTLSRLPLRHRVPNPPQGFSGREVEGLRLAERLQSRPLTLLVGPAGIGKTALVAQGLATQAEPLGLNVLYVPVPAPAPAEDVRLVIGHAFFRAGIVDEPTWRGAASDLDAISAVLLDISEAARLCVVVDDAENADRASVHALQQVLLNYAARSRWLILSAEPVLDATLAAEVLKLDGLPESELALMLQARAPGLDEAVGKRLAVAAAGSPWRLLQELGAEQAGVALQGGSRLAQLPADDRSILTMLCRAGVPLTPGQFEALGVADPGARLAALLSGGLVDSEGDAYRLHELVREELVRIRICAADADFDQRLAGVLSRSGEPEAGLAALRLWGELAQPERMLSVLEASGQGWLQRGYGRGMWQLLSAQASPLLEHWRLRVALEAASAAEIAALPAPRLSSATDQLLWGRALLSRGRFAQALEVAEAVLSRTQDAEALSQTEQLRFDAAFLAASCHANLSRWSEAVASLAAHPGPTSEAAARRGLLVARAHTLAGESAPALDALEGVRGLLPELGAYVRADMICSMAAALYELGRVGEASALLEQLDSQRGVATYSEEGRHALFQRALLEHARGHLDECRDILATLLPFVGAVSLLRPHILLLDARCRYFIGELEGLDQVLLEVSEHAQRVGNTDLSCVAENYRQLLAVDEGRALDAAARRCPVEDETSLNARMFYLYKLRASMHIADASHADHIQPTAETANQLLRRFEAREFPKVGVVALGVAAEAALLAGESARALALVDQAIELAQDLDLGVALGSTRIGRCEVLLCLGRRGELTAESARCVEVAQALGSPRVELEARFFSSIATGQRPGLASMALVAAQASVAPAASRRARALLTGSLAGGLAAAGGAGVELDAYDGLIVGAIRELQDWHVVQSFGANDGHAVWSRAWGMNAPELRVWLPGERTVDLSRRELLWRLLEVLVKHAGRATKEQLVMEAWSEREYHPLRHDNRLQAAVRKLRRAIEDVPSQPTRFVTVEDGYALGDPAFFEAAPPSA